MQKNEILSATLRLVIALYATLLGPLYATLLGPLYATLLGPLYATLLGPLYATLLGPLYATLLGPLYATLLGPLYATLLGPLYATLLGPQRCSSCERLIWRRTRDHWFQLYVLASTHTVSDGEWRLQRPGRFLSRTQKLSI
ncbi:hypothetical protein DPMN_139139 [Dreissena polymorpha]|uniref:Uncharacterized protein n=1 Tax=Dreissena polymorpha TaxID=45954 RepID=A0A9D4JKH6_DREPO|nr:hypothetical protein DPMN_139139 [Dreissena polymorpha]